MDSPKCKTTVNVVVGKNELLLRASKKKLEQLEQMKRSYSPEAREGLQKRIEEVKATINRCNAEEYEHYQFILRTAKRFRGEYSNIEKR